ncbi:hypothetical protein BO71DRAFT_485511 [Aspergillus ellipticus CBS 707.79]|uniref:Uncharacterized protein n=1 Tax=Aspergillus ellipticus CBS 707.79 TaxID=1448320 RepID=A0A319D4Y1_9EURO|nr:hypothetical protein BO71DRAFT_485511 [Aspergillus ellipticus CBS 707.79]
MKTIEDTTPETASEMSYEEPRTEDPAGSETSMMEAEISLSDMAQNSVQEMKTMLNKVYSSDIVNSMWSQVRSLASGSGEDTTQESTEETIPADPEEMHRIENLEKEKIIQFLQERHRSNAVHPGRRQ